VRVSLAPEAERDLVEGGLYYSQEATAELGRAFVSEFERSTALLGEQPELGAPWRGEMRRFPLRRFPYSIIYYLRNDSVRILAVAHQSRKPGFWRDRK
jgi:plasmid stabilization system protein ParE